MAEIKLLKQLHSNTVRSMIYKQAVNGMSELQVLAYEGLKKALENKEDWAIKCFHQNYGKIVNDINNVHYDLSNLDFSKYKTQDDIAKLCVEVAKTMLTQDNSVSATNISTIFSMLVKLKLSEDAQNSAVNLNDDQLRKIFDIVEGNNLKDVTENVKKL